MKKILVLICLSQIILFASVFPQTTKSDTINVTELKQLIQKLSNDVSEIRRDQLNYKLEKDLLKEAYSSSLNTINLVITIGLGIIALLGFLGLRGVVTLKKEYKDELENLTTMSTAFKRDVEEVGDFKKDVAEFMREVEEFKKKFQEDVSNFLTQNKEQNQKIRLIEIKEKILNLIHSNDLDRAFQEIAVAKELSPDDLELLHQEAYAYIRKRQYSEAEHSYRKLLSIMPMSGPAIVNMPEILLFQKKSDEYELFKKQNLSYLSKNRQGFLLIYLEALNAYTKGDFVGLKSIIEKYLEKTNLKEQKEIMAWEFYDFYAFLSNEPITSAQYLLQGLVNHMGGKINGEALQKILIEAK